MTPSNGKCDVPTKNAGNQIVQQRRKCENLISYFTAQIQRLTEELENEKQWRSTQLAKIVKALLCFESKLKNEQKGIRHQLFEKDTEINRLSKEIVGLREKYGEKNGEVIEIGEVAQYCPHCRKQYYQIETRDVSVQVLKSGGCAGDASKLKLDWSCDQSINL